MRIKSKTVLCCLGYLTLSVAFSSLTQRMVPALGNAVEPFILVGLLLISRYNPFKIPFRSVFLSKKCFACLTFLLAMAVVGVFTPVGDVLLGSFYKNIYADFRSCFIFIYTVFLLRDKRWTDEQKVTFLKWLVWPIIFFGGIATFEKLISNADLTGRVLECPYHYLLIQSLLYCRSRNYAVYAVLLGIGGFYAVFSLARINIFMFAAHAAMVATSVFSAKTTSNWQRMVKVATFVIFVVALCRIVPKAAEFYTSTEAGRAQVDRLSNAVNRDDSEVERKTSIYIAFVEPEFFILPEGLGWRNHVYKITTHFHSRILSTQDSCWLYLYYHFGIIGGLFFSFLLFEYSSRFVKSMHGMSVESICKLLVLAAFTLCFFTQGMFFTIPQLAFGGGCMLSLVSSMKIQNSCTNASS